MTNSKFKVGDVVKVECGCIYIILEGPKYDQQSYLCYNNKSCLGAADEGIQSVRQFDEYSNPEVIDHVNIDNFNILYE